MRTKKVFVLFKFCLTAILCAFLSSSYSQDTIYLKNPSFEDIPRKGGEFSSPIIGWRDCGLVNFPGESPPDIHPVPDAAWGVHLKAMDEKTYLGLVTRYNKTYESVSQILDLSLKPGKCYSFSGYLTQSAIYLSPTPRTLSTREMENFTAPTEFLIWGGDALCEKRELLSQSGAVRNNEWRLYEFVFSPKSEISSLTIEAYYLKSSLTLTNGHVMVDGLSPIIEIDCKN